MPDVGEFLDKLGGYALTWLPLVFFGLIIYLLWRTLQYMPRVKPPKLEAGRAERVLDIHDHECDAEAIVRGPR